MGRSVVHKIIQHDKGLSKFICNQGNKASGIYLPVQVVEGNRPPDKRVYWKIIFFISHPKHMLWILKRTVSMRRFF